ncbi:hypothetical protein ACFE04_017258 [Oxalis oulophora]
MESSLQMKVVQAIHVLNQDTESCNRVAANQWLVQFQQADSAWDVAACILTSDHNQQQQTSTHQHSLPYEAEFFAAQILKRKWALSLKTRVSSACGVLTSSHNISIEPINLPCHSSIKSPIAV